MSSMDSKQTHNQETAGLTVAAGTVHTDKPTASKPSHPYRPFSRTYDENSQENDFSQPVLYRGPRPDPHPYREDDDSGIEDYASANSISLDTSGYEYRREFGRRYHAHHQGTEYHLPNDDTELDRLDLQHACFLMTLAGQLHRAPIPQDVQEVLDVGTGTGIWTIDFADKYPSAMVTGTDLSPVQPSYVPPNCRFYVENAEEPWQFEQKFDYIHSRMLVIGIKDWKKFMSQAFDALKPGGYIELQDMNLPARCDDDTASPESPMMRWSTLMVEAAKNLGLDLTIGNKFPFLLHEAGFVDIQVETHPWPVNKWPKDKAMKKLGAYVNENTCQGLHGFTLAFFSRGLLWKPEDIASLVEKAIAQSKDLNSHIYSPISFFWARKPPAFEGNEDV